MLDARTFQTPNDVDQAPLKELLLSVRGLGLKIGRQTILQDVSFDLMDRQVLCLVGTKESGKSLLLRCLNRTAEEIRGANPCGRVQLDGRDIFDPSWDVSHLRSQVALVPREANPFPKSIWENLSYVLRLNRLAENDADLAMRIESSLHRVGIWNEVKDNLHKTPVQRMEPRLQRQVCLARALILEPRLLLLDEPPTGVGGLLPRHLEEIIPRINRDIPVVLATTSLQIAAQISERTIHIEDGRILEDDHTELVLTNPQNPQTRAFIASQM